MVQGWEYSSQQLPVENRLRLRAPAGALLHGHGCLNIICPLFLYWYQVKLAGLNLSRSVFFHLLSGMRYVNHWTHVIIGSWPVTNLDCTHPRLYAKHTNRSAQKARCTRLKTPLPLCNRLQPCWRMHVMFKMDTYYYVMPIAITLAAAAWDLKGDQWQPKLMPSKRLDMKGDQWQPKSMPSKRLMKEESTRCSGFTDGHLAICAYERAHFESLHTMWPFDDTAHCTQGN